METTDSQLEDHLHKCRCCFRILIDEFKTIKLVNNVAYSKIICELCDRDLRNFHHLKKDLVSKQRRLYELLPAAPVFVSCFKEEQVIEIKHYEYTVDDSEFEQESSGEAIEEVQSKIVMSIAPKKIAQKQIIETEVKENSETSQKFQCECGLRLSNKFSLKRHVDRVHQNVRDFRCDHCSYSAFFKHSLDRHVRTHISEEFRDRYRCDLCEFISISAVNIVLHKKFEHSNSKKFVCRYESCRKEFSRPTQLTAHTRLTHEKRKDKTCCICNKAFSTTTRLAEHIQNTHSNLPRQFTCEFCSKLFATFRQLSQHKTYHEEPKYQCKICGKKFYKPVLLEGHHTSVHLNKKDYVCTAPNCDQKYYLKSHLLRHTRSVHEKLKLFCELCSSKFVRKDTLKRHILTQHSELTYEEREALVKKIRLMKN